MKYKCTGCFKTWPKSKLRPDPLRSETLICPSCEWPCAPIYSPTFVSKDVLTPQDGLSISMEPKIDLTEGMKEAILSLEDGHRASIKALERWGLVADGELTEEGQNIFNQLKGE